MSLLMVLANSSASVWVEGNAITTYVNEKTKADRKSVSELLPGFLFTRQRCMVRIHSTNAYNSINKIACCQVFPIGCYHFLYQIC